MKKWLLYRYIYILIVSMHNKETNIQVVLYIANKLKEKWIELSETKLYKLLWFASLWMADNAYSLIFHDVFIKKQFWPVPENLNAYIDEIKESQTGKDMFISVRQESKNGFGDGYKQNTIEALQQYDEKYFTPNMKKALDETIKKYGSEKASKLSDISHSKAWNDATDHNLVDITKDMTNEDYKEIVKEQYEDIVYILKKLKYAF